MYTRAVQLAVVLVYVAYCAATDESQADREAAIRAYQQLAETRKGLSALKRVVEDIDDDLTTQHKRSSCHIGAGHSGYHCHLAALYRYGKHQAHEFVNNSPFSPGKRASPLISFGKRWGASCAIGAGTSGYGCHLAALHSSRGTQGHDFVNFDPFTPGKRKRSVESVVQRRLEGIQRKRNGLNMLRKILTEMDADVIHEQKRACQFNLGGHCATESAASLADQWHYLNSPLSPGRKRRDTGLYKKLISGKLIQ